LYGRFLNMGPRAGFCTRTDRLVHLTLCRRMRPNFAHRTSSSIWENLASPRMLSRSCALLNGHSREWVWKAIGDRLQWPHYLSSFDHERKLKVGGKGRIMGNIPLLLGPSNAGTNYVQK